MFHPIEDFHKYIQPGKRVHLAGIGGVSMCALAEVLQGMGVTVQGSDMSDSATVQHLRSVGIPVAVGHSAENLKNCDAVIRTAAIHDNNPEIAGAVARGIPVYERAQAWGAIMQGYRNALCVSGTHGISEEPYIARTQGTRTFPWRLAVVAGEDADLIENELVWLLAAPAADTDWEWVKPGLVSWDWWNGMRLSGVDFRAGRNTESYRYYIDFAAKYGVPYIIMDEGWSASTTDVFRPNPDLDLPGLIAYGKERNVQIVLWLTWLAVEKDMERLFMTLEEWGIPGVKIDFMDRSDQWMVNYYERVTKCAADHHIFVDWHGSYTPKGLFRTYPNLLTYEAVLGMEQGGRCKPDNSNYLPFIRNAVGPMDFTPGGMFCSQPEDNRSTGSNPMASGTRAYQLALYVVFESPLQMMADNPVYYYREHPCTEFIASVPTTWDELRVLRARCGEQVVMARRKGDRWFIGGITNNQPYSTEVALDFLPAGRSYTMTSFEDGVNADLQAMDYKKRERKVDASTVVKIDMVRNGGWAAVIE